MEQGSNASVFTINGYAASLPAAKEKYDSKMLSLCAASDSDDDSDDGPDDDIPPPTHDLKFRSTTPKPKPLKSPTREKFIEVRERFENKLIEERAKLFNMTDDEYCDIREMNCLPNSKDERSIGKNTDLDEECLAHRRIVT